MLLVCDWSGKGRGGGERELNVDVVGSGGALRGGWDGAGRGADLMLVGMFICGIWMLDCDGTAPDLDDGDGGWRGMWTGRLFVGVCFRGAGCQGLRRLWWCDWGCCLFVMGQGREGVGGG